MVIRPSIVERLALRVGITLLSLALAYLVCR